ncbi:MAG: hypothetical protein KGL39_42365 [Patescibacteria group bacterium]|nr:hypothetical protein [Patescibacteria group bacterium]
MTEDDNMVTARRLAILPQMITTTALRWTPSPAVLDLDNPADWAMEPYDVPKENADFLKGMLVAELEPSVIPIRRLPTL